MNEDLKKFIENVEVENKITRYQEEGRDTIVVRKFAYTIGYMPNKKLKSTVNTMLAELYDAIPDHFVDDSIDLTIILKYMPEDK